MESTIKDRQHYNKQILEYLAAYADRYPDMRFGQILSNLNIATHYKGYNEHTQESAYSDIFYTESEDTHSVVLLSLPTEGWG